MGKETKTKPQPGSDTAMIAAISPDRLRQDSAELVELLGKATGAPAVLWGTSIIGFGSYDYIYPSGHAGTAAKVGFAARKSGLVIYLCPGFQDAGADLAALGPHKAGKGCLYLKSLDGIDRGALACLAKKAVAQIDERYPQT
ncbi:MAG: DUF1801 domain-containing protein [Rhizobiaceae bacterium]